MTHLNENLFAFREGGFPKQQIVVRPSRLHSMVLPLAKGELEGVIAGKMPAPQ